MLRSPVDQLGAELAKVAMNMQLHERLAFYLATNQASQVWLEQHYREKRAGYSPNDRQAASEAAQAVIGG